MISYKVDLSSCSFAAIALFKTCSSLVFSLADLLWAFDCDNLASAFSLISILISTFGEGLDAPLQSLTLELCELHQEKLTKYHMAETW